MNDRLKEQNKAADAKEGDKLDWKMRAGGSSLGRCKNSGLTSAYSSYHRAGQGRGGREGEWKKEGKERLEEVVNIDLGLFCVYLDYNNRNVSWAKMQSGKLKNQD